MVAQLETKMAAEAFVAVPTPTLAGTWSESFDRNGRLVRMFVPGANDACSCARCER